MTNATKARKSTLGTATPPFGPPACWVSVTLWLAVFQFTVPSFATTLDIISSPAFEVPVKVALPV
jgi:hypothetical protein